MGKGLAHTRNHTGREVRTEHVAQSAGMGILGTPRGAAVNSVGPRLGSWSEERGAVSVYIARPVVSGQCHLVRPAKVGGLCRRGN